MVGKKHGLGFLLILLCLPMVLGGQSLRIASIAPENSEYGRILAKINAEWMRVSNNQVRMQLIHGGAAGAEDEVIRRMRSGTLQGGLFTSQGLGRLSPEVLTLSTPLVIRTDGEMSAVLKAMEGDLDGAIAREGYVVIAWARAGWLYFFSRSPQWTPQAVRQRKVGVSPSDRVISAMFENLGYRPTPVSLPEQLSALNSNLIDTILVNPLSALQFGWYEKANNFFDMKVAPFLGAILVDARAWNRVPGILQAQLIRVAREIVSRDLEPVLERLEREAINTMTRSGLLRTNPDATQRQAWELEFARGAEALSQAGGIDAATLVKVRSLLTSFRANGSP